MSCLIDSTVASKSYMAVFTAICFNFAILFKANLALFALLLSILAEALREPDASIFNPRYVNSLTFSR